MSSYDYDEFGSYGGGGDTSLTGGGNTSSTGGGDTSSTGYTSYGSSDPTSGNINFNKAPPDYEPYSVTHNKSKTPYIVVLVITILLFIIWCVVLVVTHQRKTWLWAWTRPTTLPGQTGDTIFPTEEGMGNLPTDLKNRVVALGGKIKQVENPEQVAKLANDQAKLWQNYSPPNP